VGGDSCGKMTRKETGTRRQSEKESQLGEWTRSRPSFYRNGPNREVTEGRVWQLKTKRRRMTSNVQKCPLTRVKKIQCRRCTIRGKKVRKEFLSHQLAMGATGKPATEVPPALKPVPTRGRGFVAPKVAEEGAVRPGGMRPSGPATSAASGKKTSHPKP